MNCDEFLSQFREALDGKVSEQIIQENINYYRSYINSHAVNGKSEEEVIKSLGEPRLLAKTIEESSKFAEGRGFTEAQDNNDGYACENANKNKLQKIPGWIKKCIVIIAVFLIVMVVFRMFVFMMPVIAVMVVAGALYKAFVNWKNKY